MIKIIEILDKYNITYITEGSNVKEGNINIKCPFCYDDPSCPTPVQTS